MSAHAHHGNPGRDGDADPVTVETLRGLKSAGQKFAALTAYDATFAAIEDAAGVDLVLVGDSLGMVVQGRESTVPVTVEEMVYHGAMAARGCRRALLMIDMPFMSYASVDLALRNGMRLMQEGGARILKLEGGRQHLEKVRALSANGVPVCGHLGLLPQSIHKLGGYRVQAKEQREADVLVEEALALEDAGAEIMLVECIPAALGERLRDALRVPLIGIGAGPACDAQILVVYDMLGLTPGRKPRFVRNFLDGQASVLDAIKSYVDSVKDGTYPNETHWF